MRMIYVCVIEICMRNTSAERVRFCYTDNTPIILSTPYERYE